MVNSLKEVLVVLTIAVATFRLAKPVALRFSTESDFARRRIVWLILTIIAFVGPNFWFYVLVAIPVMLIAGRRDSNPVAFYLMMLQVVPSIPVDIPTVGINELFALDNYRLLSLCVLTPIWWRLRQAKSHKVDNTNKAMDILLLGYGVMLILLYVPADLPNHLLLPDSVTNMLRRAFLFFVDVWVLYYAVSRTCASRSALLDALAALCLGCALMAVVACFESVYGWLLYADIESRWTIGHSGVFYDLRGGVLRAKASSGGSLSLGFLLAIAIGIWQYLQSRIPSRLSSVAVLGLLLGGLFATFARGAWLGAFAIQLLASAIGPHGLRRSMRALLMLLAFLAVASITPFGQKAITTIPLFGGTARNDTLDYRKRLAERSWELVKQHPLLGDQLAKTEMEDLRQGEGIVDFVNSYAEIAVFYGLIGLSLLVGFMIVGLFKCYRRLRLVEDFDPDLALLGARIVACSLGALLMMADDSFHNGVEKIFYVLGAFAAAYVRLQAAPGSPTEPQRVPA